MQRGFVSSSLKSPGGSERAVDDEHLRTALRELGIGEEFFGRLTHVFLFQGLHRSACLEILHRKLAELQAMADLRGLRLSFAEAVVEHLNLADAQGELRGVREIRLVLADTPTALETPYPAGTTTRRRSGETLFISLS
jgi:ATP-dependent Clp protease ATP-binding subunit ClpA